MKTISSSLPALDPSLQQHSERVSEFLRTQIKQAGGWLSFEAWMDLALYAPNVGYYDVGTQKLAQLGAKNMASKLGGDFITAPELSPYYGRTIARQLLPVLQSLNTPSILEFGAGSGVLAKTIIRELQQLGYPVQYHILEVSNDLKQRQQECLADLADCVQWLDALPTHFTGCVIANEVLDAMPVSLFCWQNEQTILERGVGLDSNDHFIWIDQVAPPALARLVADRMPCLPGYVSEINRRAEAWVQGIGQWLDSGLVLLIDYGFPRHEYYHPQRLNGTLMCHRQHHAYSNPFVSPGIQDITAHVDFTAIAEAATAANLEVLGYTSQASFLMHAGIIQLLQELDPSDVLAYSQAIAPIQTLLSEAEMGELFKVIALGRQVTTPLNSFARGDRRHTL